MTNIYQSTRNKENTIAELRTATKTLIENDIDMIICEVMLQCSNYIFLSILVFNANIGHGSSLESRKKSFIKPQKETNYIQSNRK